jgi:phage-related protein
MEQLRPLPLQLWRSAAGNEPTRDWFRALPDDDRKVLGKDLRRLQFAWPVGMPLVRYMGKNIWELRTSLPSHREARVLFAVDPSGIAVLNAFIKKSQKTPENELKLAQKRLKEL